ncbi:MAG: ferritin-like domain-containing protein [Hahellaceae bacterium]|nr:ferritin-like domain-containing protein [Hahellaceae bacterium]MCP5211414.1 ferritin-like domain-containing protein [Hahellaceae bacterium]
MLLNKMLDGIPGPARNRVEATLENVSVMMQLKSPKVAASMAPSAVRGLFMRQGKHHDSVKMTASHDVHFDLKYGLDFPEMNELYRRAVANQWDGDRDLDWSTQVDPMNPEIPIVNADFLPFEGLREYGIKLNKKEMAAANYNMVCWFLSQFMHGEQGALYASAQVTECVKWMDGKLYGATQVMDEGRHLEVFLRYLDTKLEKTYQINDNLFVIIDDLLTDSRWDIKFLGMQIMIEGLALGAFSTLHNNTQEPLLKNLLRYVIQDEARHVHYGVLALREHFSKELTAAEKREREDWAFEVALLMRNRFMGHEVYEENYEGLMTRRQWNEFILKSPAMQRFRSLMFKRLIPNLEYIGLLTPRVKGYYESAGLWQFRGGKNASQLTEADLVADLV